MKLALLLLFLLKMAASNTLLDEEEGICSNFPSSCPKIQQKKGVCCRRGSSKSLGYHNNFCLACVAGCEVFVFKRKDNGLCSTEEL